MVSLTAGVAAAIAAMALVARSPRLAAGLIAALALYGALMSMNFIRAIRVFSAASPGPAAVLSFLLALSVGASWLAALGHLLWARRHAGAPRVA